MKSKPIPTEDEIFLEWSNGEYINHKGSSKELWKRTFFQASDRLSLWSRRMDSQIRKNLEVDGKIGNKYSKDYIGYFNDAVSLLIDATSVRKDPSSRYDLDFLIRLNDYLSIERPLSGINVPSYPRHSLLIKEFFSEFGKNPDILLAVFAIYDIHMDQYSRTAHTYKRLRPIKLYPEIFRSIVSGFNVGILRDRWDRIFQNFLMDREGEDKRKKFERNQIEIADDIKDIIYRINSDFGNKGINVGIDHAAISNLGWLALDEDEIFNTIFLSIIADSELKCYEVEACIESLGKFLPKHSKKTFLQEEENGARRFELGVYLDSNNIRLITQIATRETFLINTWGRLMNFPSFAVQIKNSHSRTKSASKKAGNNVIYKTNGEISLIKNGYSVSEFINDEYLDISNKILMYRINGIPKELSYILQNGDLLDIVFHDDNKSGFYNFEDDYRQDKLFSNELVARSRSKQDLEILRGKNRIILEIQQHLNAWKFKIDEHQVSILLGSLSFLFNDASLEDIYYRLATDRKNDWKIFQFVLQYKLRGRVQQLGNKALPGFYNWKNIKIAQCCKPNFEDEIVGTVWKSPRNPDHPAYKRYHEIKIHKRDCGIGPEKNIIDLEWVNSDKHKTGFVIEALIKDEVGCLGEILDLLYLTNITMHSVYADGIYYHDHASIVITATAFTKDELDSARDLLIKRYGKDTIRTRYLRKLEIVQLVNKRKSNPYILSSEPELEKHLPILFYGRSDELRKLSYLMHDKNNRRILLKGYYRVGKTWFLKQFKTTFQMPGRIIVYISVNNINLSSSPIREFVYEMFLWTVKSLEENNLMLEKLHQRPQNFSELTSWIDMVYREIGYEFIFLLDEFSVINDWLRNNNVNKSFVKLLRNFIFGSKSIAFVLVFQSSYIYNLVDRNKIFDAEFFSYFSGQHDDEITLRPLNKIEITDLITRPVTNNYKFSKNSLDYAYQLCGGMPFIAAVLGKTIWDYVYDKDIKNISVKTLAKIVILIKNNPQWSFYLDTIVGKLRQRESFIVLKAIANIENNEKNLKVTKEIIQGKTKLSLQKVEQNMDALTRANLIEQNKGYWKVSGTILSFYLANIVDHA